MHEYLVYYMKYDVDIIINREWNTMLIYIGYILNLRFMLRRYLHSTNILESNRGRLLGGESWKRFSWMSLWFEKIAYLTGHINLPCYMRELGSY